MVEFLRTDEMAPGEAEAMRKVGETILGASQRMGFGFFCVFMVPTEDGTNLHYCANVDRDMVKSVIEDMLNIVEIEEATTRTMQ
jgi:hypothetical protein